MMFMFRVGCLFVLLVLLLVGLAAVMSGNAIGGCILLAIVFCVFLLDGIAISVKKTAAVAEDRRYRPPEAWPQPELPSDPLADHLAEEAAMEVLAPRRKPLR